MPLSSADYFCDVAPGRLEALLGSGLGLTGFRSDDQELDAKGAIDEYIEAGVLDVHLSDSELVTVFFMLKLRRLPEDSGMITFVFEGSSESDLTLLTTLEIQIRDRQLATSLRHLSPNKLFAQIEMPMVALFDKKKRLAVRPLRLRLSGPSE